MTDTHLQLDAPLLTEKQPIGVFDSGIGGLTVVDCIKHLLPNEQLIYFADNLHAPYGDKTTEVIIERVNKIAEYFIQQQVKAIVIACNTATAIAIDQLRKKVNIPIIGVEPAIKPAVLMSKNQKIAILTTKATAQNNRFRSLVETHITSHSAEHENAKVLIQPCPGLVEQIELGELSSPATHQLLFNYLKPLQEQGIDTLVLGCTHYPMVKDMINTIMQNNVTLIDTGLPVATQLKNRLANANLLNSSNHADVANTANEETAKLVLKAVKNEDQWLSTQPLSDAIRSMFPYQWQCIDI